MCLSSLYLTATESHTSLYVPLCTHHTNPLKGIDSTAKVQWNSSNVDGQEGVPPNGRHPLSFSLRQQENHLVEDDSQREGDAEVGHEGEHGETLQFSYPATDYDQR